MAQVKKTMHQLQVQNYSLETIREFALSKKEMK